MTQGTREQRNAKKAFELVSKVQTEKKEYRTLSQKFPVMVLQCGLIQSLVFLKSKGKGHHLCFLEHLADHLKSFQVKGIPTTGNTKEDLITNLISIAQNAPMPVYRLLIRETLAIAGWHKRFAAALFHDVK